MNQTMDNMQDIEDFLGEKKKPFWKRKIVWIPALVVLALLLLWSIFGGGDDQVDYITEEVETRSLDLVVTATGNLRPTNQVEVGSEVSGRIDEVLVDVNDVVRRGQVLALINTDVIDDQITQGRANLNAMRAAVQQAQATLEVDEAQLARLQEVYRLSDGRVPSQQEMQAAEGAVRRDQAALASARANVTSAQASLSSAQTNRDRAVIRSPVSGVVLARQVEPGQTVAASFNTPTLFILAEDLSVMQLRVKVDEADVGQVEAGQTATFTVDAYPGREFPASVERVDLASGNISTASQTQGSSNVVEYEARLTVDNASGLLRPGMTATANVETENTAAQMVVPNGALRFEPPQEEEAGGVNLGGDDFGLAREEERATIGAGSRQTVYVLGEENELRPIIVTTGLSDGRHTIVSSDELQPGMQVVTAIRAGNQ
ncbi:efflux RND transporter periplasmic adaptor subunit [Alteraurantiacibacter aquimixticola]|uniref:Efflux RND transporter periplasmic adaptor subunit n=2 Tax=Alteraurantiacibacter aquimixticola TaxID=2489173 RepID=A0A4T3F7F7_9SPHN|nr:efflux RND transporter periplasmic adaptor subunit [Alteraurantiacibacter aquimixticola]TIX50806.1 efflux RND transporter periplasmic adaptor subunit [Alteraurantiacibacter aquimixticola]